MHSYNLQVKKKHEINYMYSNMTHKKVINKVNIDNKMNFTSVKV